VLVAAHFALLVLPPLPPLKSWLTKRCHTVRAPWFSWRSLMDPTLGWGQSVSVTDRLDLVA
jgi:hypothetical protein